MFHHPPKLTCIAVVPHVLSLHVVLQVLILNIVATTHHKHNAIRKWSLCPWDLSSFVSSQDLWVQILVLVIVLPLLLLHDVIHYLGDGKVVFFHHQILHPGHHKVA